MAKLLGKAIKEKNIKFLCKAFFNTEPTKTQLEIIRTIAFRETKRLVISAYTRHGKSWSVSQGILLYIFLNSDKRILLIAPTSDQTGILRNYMTSFILESEFMTDLLDLEASGADRIKKEISRSRITFKNGCELKVLSAAGTAERLMGWGGDLIVMDESCLIDYEVYRQKISRMLGDSPNSMLVSIGNPWHRNNQMYEHWTDPNFTKIHIDYKTGIKEGRITKEYVDEQRHLLTEMEFEILYNANFPEEAEDQLIKGEWIKRAINKEMEGLNDKVAGLDVAEFGMDWTVLTKGYTDGTRYKATSINYWDKQDTMQTVSKTIPNIDKETTIYVDATGVGSGVHARLKELTYKAVEVKVGRSPEAIIKTEKKKFDRFMNQKAQFYWKLRELFENGNISIPNNHHLIKELLSMRYEITSGGKIRIIDPDKSPDFADSLMLMCSGYKRKFVMAFV